MDIIGLIRKRYNMDTEQLKRIADAMEEILRLVKKDQEQYAKKEKE
jgi:negative regulator of sigma E activity